MDNNDSATYFPSDTAVCWPG